MNISRALPENCLMEKCLFPLDTYMVSCPTWSKHWWLSYQSILKHHFHFDNYFRFHKCMAIDKTNQCIANFYKYLSIFFFSTISHRIQFYLLKSECLVTRRIKSGLRFRFRYVCLAIPSNYFPKALWLLLMEKKHAGLPS